MFFTLKKVVGGLLLPLPFLLLLMGLAIVLLWFTRWQKTGKGLLTASWLVLLLLSLQPVADSLLKPIEETYPTRQQNDGVEYIVVLGGGYTWNPDWAPSSNLFANNLPRVTEAVRLWQTHPEATLVFTGAAAIGNPVTTAGAGARVAESLGVPKTHIITLDTAKDTEDEAHAVAELIGQQPFILLTSASHLPRAMTFFHQVGMHPLPAPANQLAINSPLNPWESLFPSPTWLMHSDRAVYETLGTLWQKLRAPHDASHSQSTRTDRDALAQKEDLASSD